MVKQRARSSAVRHSVGESHPTHPRHDTPSGSVMVEQASTAYRTSPCSTTLPMEKHSGKDIPFSSTHTRYSGNLLCDDATPNTASYAREPTTKTLIAIRHCIANALSEIIGRDYTGWLGVDMLLDRDGMIAPCIEGQSTHDNGRCGPPFWPNAYLRRTPMPYTSRATFSHGRKYSPTIVDGRLIAGELMLTPPEERLTSKYP